ncbi:lysophospholipid acyltransferase family protein [Novosphingobium sp. 9]|uniref:lysophospholipid acyltransferase family protein n=1 Tax=Novosphingobium sp. 9 TaxID=2025349 RepID=UPI0021B640C4|nr:lysophospholipid acyltransferase family protein [Novosphingobium sp. 9]
MRTSAADVVRSLAFYIIFYLGTLAMVLVTLVAARIDHDLLVRMVAHWAGFHRGCARMLLGIEVRIEGQIPTDGVLVAMKHESFFEAIDLPLLFDRPAPFPKAELTRLPGWGKAALAYGVVPVERDQGAKALRAMVAQGRAFAAEGRALVLFPEGTRVPHGQRPPLQSGFAGLYKMIGVPVVPIAVDSGRLYHRLWKKPGVITFRVGARIEPGLPRAEAEAQVLAAINALNG